jgi:hypothetical protein
VVTEGVLLTYKVHRAGDRNQVDVTYDHADIDRVLVVAEDVPGAAEPVKLQRPIVDRRQCETAVRLADGQSLMIGGMTSSERLVSFAITRVRERPNKFSAAESELWEEAAKRRRDQTTAEIERRLKTTKLDMKASDAPLDAVLQAIGKQADINVVVDERGLAVEGLSAKTPVNFEVKEVSAAAALTALLKPLKLATEIRDEVLVVTSQNQNDIRVYANVYNVADLVIPVPKMVSLGGENEKAKGRAVADFDSLIDLTTSTITPDFWNEKGGPAAIQPFPTNLSLVVSHNQNGHQQIEELFGQLRQLQDVQIALELKLYKAAPGLAGVEAGRVRSLSQKRGGEFVELLEKEAELVSKVKVTLFNGQGLEAPLPFGRSRDDAEALVHLVPVVSDDRRSVTIQSTSNAQDTIDAMRRFQSRILKDGSYLVVNATSRDAIPMLGSLPYLGGLFRKTPPDQGQWVLICRPQIIVREEEEEKLGIELPRPLRR